MLSQKYISGANVRVVIDVASVLAAYVDRRCTVHTHTHTRQVYICCQNTDIYNDTHIGTRYVILAKHWKWLPDDGSI